MFEAYTNKFLNSKLWKTAWLMNIFETEYHFSVFNKCITPSWVTRYLFLNSLMMTSLELLETEIIFKTPTFIAFSEKSFLKKSEKFYSTKQFSIRKPFKILLLWNHIQLRTQKLNVDCENKFPIILLFFFNCVFMQDIIQ